MDLCNIFRALLSYILTDWVFLTLVIPMSWSVLIWPLIFLKFWSYLAAQLLFSTWQHIIHLSGVIFDRMHIGFVCLLVWHTVNKVPQVNFATFHLFGLAIVYTHQGQSVSSSGASSMDFVDIYSIGFLCLVASMSIDCSRVQAFLELLYSTPSSCYCLPQAFPFGSFY